MFFKSKGSSNRIERIWCDALAFHGNGCPMLALGVRVCDTALTALAITAPAERELICVSEHDGCCVDALQIGLHCTRGRKRLLFYKTGKLIFTVYDLQQKHSVRICTQREVSENILSKPVDWILSAPVDELFYFEDALPLAERVKERAMQICRTAPAAVPPRNGGVMDSTEQFAQFDTPDNGFGYARRSRR